MEMAPADHRYAGLQSPTCDSCHPNVLLGKDNIEMHTVHGADLSCQVCHSITYTSCDGCHVAISEKTGNPYFETDGTYFTFLIGLNPQRSYTRPYKYVPLRHIPATPDGFSYYGENLQPNFNALPTWAYATPHNIQLKTPQTESCNACHGNLDLFLTADKVNPEELEANLPVIVPTVPEAIPEETEGNPSP
jgi:thiosulfate/3-mercaptopyruvate sulfurtransferase